MEHFHGNVRMKMMRGAHVCRLLATCSLRSVVAGSILRGRFWLLVASLVAGFIPGAELARGADPTLDFLAALRRAGLHDTSIEYIDSLDAADDVADDVRQRLPYERAMALAEQARQTPKAEDRRELAAEAAAAFETVAHSDPGSETAILALREAANLHAETALAALSRQARLPAQAASQRSDLTATARQSFAAAKSAAQAVLEQSQQQLSALPKAAVAQADPQAMAARDFYETKSQEARFLSAKIEYEVAKTYPRDDEQRKQQLEAASKSFRDLFVEYENRLVGFYGRLYEGRCYQEAGQHTKALACFRDLVDVKTTNASFRQLMALAMRGRLESLIAEEKLDDAVDEGRQWLQQSEGAERRKPEWLGVALRLANALAALVSQLEPGDSAAAKLTAEARLLLREVADTPNEFQQQARSSMAALGQATGKQEDAYNDFDGAFAAGKRALELRGSSQMAARLAAQNNPDAVDDLEQQVGVHTAAASDHLQRALALATADTDPAALNTARYLLSVLFVQAERFAEAAVLSEFVARRYPDDANAENAARVALAAVENLYRVAREDPQRDPGYPSRRLSELAEFIVAQWPLSRQATTATNLLINVALADDRLADAEAMLKRLPAESKPAVELSLGSALWRQYLEATAGVDGLEGPPGDSAARLKKRALELLRQGFKGVKEAGEPSAAAATGVLYLAQALLAQGDAAGALNALEDPQVGPLTLIQQGHPAAGRAEFVRAAQTAALRAYLAAQPPQRKQAQAAMEALEQAADGNADLTRVYISLGVQLQQQVKQLNAQGLRDQARSVAAAFEDVLLRVSERGDANSWTIRNWLAQTNLQLGEVLAGGDRTRYIERAKDSYVKILEAAEQDPNFAPSPSQILAVRKRLADCERGLGNFEEALSQYAAILKRKPSMLELQKAAAETLQQQGATQKDVDALDRAIFGALPQADRKNLVWGWVRLAKIVDTARRRAAANPAMKAKAEKYADLFFTARYNAAKARYLMAQVGPPAQRPKSLATARSSVASMKALYPNLGGPSWKPAFEDLLNQIDSALSDKGQPGG